jgi:hypothetical protein
MHQARIPVSHQAVVAGTIRLSPSNCFTPAALTAVAINQFLSRKMMSRDDEIMTGQRVPSGWKLFLFIAGLGVAVGISKLVGGIVGATAVIALFCGYVLAHVEIEIRRHLK